MDETFPDAGYLILDSGYLIKILDSGSLFLIIQPSFVPFFFQGGRVPVKQD
jgi:hypothetical protein